MSYKSTSYSGLMCPVGWVFERNLNYSYKVPRLWKSIRQILLPGPVGVNTCHGHCDGRVRARFAFKTKEGNPFGATERGKKHFSNAGNRCAPSRIYLNQVYY